MLAIVIPYYKITFFEATLHSLANQTDQRFQVYIGDDASPENPDELLKKFEGKFNFKYNRFNNNLGGTSLVKQWERCIDMLENESWFMILGDDDMLGSDVVEAWYKHKEIFENKTSVIRFATQLINEKGASYYIENKHPQWESASGFIHKKITGKVRSSLSEYIFFKKSYIKNGFAEYPIGWYSDNRALIDFSENKPIYSINNSFVYVRQSHLNLSNGHFKKQEKLKAANLFFNYLLESKFYLFSTYQKLDILLAFESVLKLNSIISFKQWKYFFYKYLTNFKIVPMLKFLRRFLLFYIRK